MTAAEIAAKLRESADLIERRDPPSMVPDISVREACRRLDVHLNEYNLELSVWKFSHTPEKPLDVRWKLYVDGRSYEHKSLLVAVDMAINGYLRSPSVESIDDALECPSDIDDGVRRALVESCQ